MRAAGMRSDPNGGRYQKWAIGWDTVQWRTATNNLPRMGIIIIFFLVKHFGCDTLCGMCAFFGCCLTLICWQVWIARQTYPNRTELTRWESGSRIEPAFNSWDRLRIYHLYDVHSSQPKARPMLRRFILILPINSFCSNLECWRIIDWDECEKCEILCSIAAVWHKVCWSDEHAHKHTHLYRNTQERE